ncbi:MAG: ArsR family transcriptional regulator [Haloferacaceae archaeon]
MSGKEWEPGNVFDVFGDEIARRVIVVASQGPISADDLAERMNASLPTIYRRVNALVEYDLLSEGQAIDGEGNHYKTFETALQRVSFEVTESGYDVAVEMDRGLADQFQRFWADLDDGSAELSFTVDEELTEPGDGTHHG